MQLTLVATIAILFACGRVSAQAFEQQELVPSSSGIAAFGLRLTLDGDVLVGGAPTDDTAGESAGAAYVYRRDAATRVWKLEQRLLARAPQNYSLFGLSVAIDGDVLAVAAPGYQRSGIGDAGAVYVFRRDAASATWIEEQQLFAAGGLSGDRLGLALDMSSDRIVAGSLYDDTPGGVDAGSATVFHYQDPVVLWVEEATLIDPDGGVHDYAGWDVAIEGTTIAVASPRSSEGGFSDAGSVAIWNRVGGSFTQIQELQPSFVSNSRFGSSIALRGTQLLVGAPEEDDPSGLTHTGAAYLFLWNGSVWTEKSRFLPPEPDDSDNQFGYDVDVRGDLVVIGEPYDRLSPISPFAGAGWLFRRRNADQPWVVDEKLLRSAAEGHDTLGVDVDLGDDVIALGAPSARTSAGLDSGAIDLYDSAELTLTITPEAPAAGAWMEFEVHRGDPIEKFLITVENVDGMPFFLPVISGFFGADHSRTYFLRAPDPLLGVRVGLRAWKVSATGAVVFSAMELVDV